ncbi:hypothetical protein IKQ26_03770 [bacterium]|nr:hypothetical protein [bacterium]
MIVEVHLTETAYLKIKATLEEVGVKPDDYTVTDKLLSKVRDSIEFTEFAEITKNDIFKENVNVSDYEDGVFTVAVNIEHELEYVDPIIPNNFKSFIEDSLKIIEEPLYCSDTEALSFDYARIVGTDIIINDTETLNEALEEWEKLMNNNIDYER